VEEKFIHNQDLSSFFFGFVWRIDPAVARKHIPMLVRNQVQE